MEIVWSWNPDSYDTHTCRSSQLFFEEAGSTRSKSVNYGLIFAAFAMPPFRYQNRISYNASIASDPGLAFHAKRHDFPTQPLSDDSLPSLRLSEAFVLFIRRQQIWSRRQLRRNWPSCRSSWSSSALSHIREMAQRRQLQSVNRERPHTTWLLRERDISNDTKKRNKLQAFLAWYKEYKARMFVKSDSPSSFLRTRSTAPEQPPQLMVTLNL